ncbi:hypothetical protein B0J17DRAFT_724931 [Rhizoctonia solani]|nr:hypothetical protein B0J17DRAFT_724931 [Rhizoctonia solani]
MKYHFKNASELPEGVWAPKELKKPTLSLSGAIMPWVTSNILECDPNSVQGKILVFWGPSETSKFALAWSLGVSCLV